VGIDTYDLPSFEIDISPWLGILCDGMSHAFELKLWGMILRPCGGLWVDEKGNQTNGTADQSSTPDPAFKFTPLITSNSSANTSLWAELIAHRTLYHSATITTSSGSRTLSWSQSLSHTNIQNFTPSGYNETLYQLRAGTSTFSPASAYHAPITNTFSYPIGFYQANIIPEDATTTNSTLVADLDRSLLSSSTPILQYLTSPAAFTVPEVLATRQNESCIYFWNNTYYEFAGAIDPAKGTIGETEQWFSYLGPRAG